MFEQIEMIEVVKLFATGYGAGIVLSTVPFLIGTVVGFAINLMRK